MVVKAASSMWVHSADRIKYLKRKIMDVSGGPYSDRHSLFFLVWKTRNSKWIIIHK